jgi:hypothetical protein
VAESKSGYRRWVGYVAVLLIGGGGLAALAVALRAKPVVPNIESTAASAMPAPAMPASAPPAPAPQRQPAVEVEKLVARWFDAFLGGRVDDVVSLSSEPFYFGDKVILTKPDLRRTYLGLQQEKGAEMRTVEVSSIKVQSVRELQAGEVKPSKDSLLSKLNLSQDDYVATVIVMRSEHHQVAARRWGDGYEIAGFD